MTEPGGVSITDSYNNLGELTGQSGSGADAATPARVFGYDAAGNLTSAATANTAPSGSPSNATSESFTYNDRGEVLTASGTAGSTSYSYDGDGQVTSVADAAGTTSYGYDSAGRLGTLADPASGITATYSYNNDNQVTGISYGSGGDSESLGYDSLHRLTSQTLQTGSGSTVASVSYGYNPDGQVTSMDTAGLAGPASSSYGYDEAGRLTSWDNGTTTTQYGYDGDGNLTRDGAKTYSYDARDELTSDGTSSYTYTARGTPSSESSPSGTVAVTFDAYGDQATAGTGSYTYDALGRLTASQPAGSGTSYAFSYAGKTSAIAADGAATYTWDPSGSTLVGTGAAGGGSGVLAFTDSHGDALGQFAPAATGMTGSQAYDPWGTVTATSGSLAGGLGFQGAWADPGTGKDLMGARWYDPGAGDFTSADSVQVPPVPDPAAGNPYAYAADDPLSGTDPTGHMLIRMLPDGGNYYRTAPAPARPVASPTPPPSYYARQAARAFTAMAHSMGPAVPADAHKPKPAAKPAQSSLDACAGNINVCLAGYIRSHGGQVTRQGQVTLAGYHPGPANPGTCGTRTCYNILTGRALKPSVIPAASPGCTGIMSGSLMNSGCKVVKGRTSPSASQPRPGGNPGCTNTTQPMRCIPIGTQFNGSEAGTGNNRGWQAGDTLGECLALGLASECTNIVLASGGEDSGTNGGPQSSNDDSPNTLVNALLNGLFDAGEKTAQEGVQAAINTGDVSVYQATNSAGDVNYIGITNNIERRAAEQLASKNITINPISGMQNLSRSDARAVEQVMIEQNGGPGGGQLINKINSIARSNPIYGNAIARGCQILAAIGRSAPNVCG